MPENVANTFLDLGGLTRFKTKQDQFNAATYIPLTQKAAANGVATLDNNGLVPASQLPSYVDDVLSYVSLANFPEEGETSKIYVDETTGKIYRWAAPAEPEGTGAYINISSAVSVADEAVKLQTARTINGVAFDGTANITLPTATTTVAGTVIPGTNIDLDTSTGTISVKTGSASDLGLVKVGDNINVGTGANAGTISVNTATSSQKGVVQIGTNLDVANGVVSVATATDAALGVAQAGTNIDVANGVFSVKTGSTSDKGVLQVGTNLDVANGVVSVATGSTSGKGVLQVGTNIDVANGVISVKTGSTTDLGLVSVGDNITVSNGEISLTASNVEDALGYTMTPISNAQIDALFAPPAEEPGSGE